MGAYDLSSLNYKPLLPASDIIKGMAICQVPILKIILLVEANVAWVSVKLPVESLHTSPVFTLSFHWILPLKMSFLSFYCSMIVF